MLSERAKNQNLMNYSLNNILYFKSARNIIIQLKCWDSETRKTDDKN